MWKEPLLIVGMVIIATCVVVGLIAVFAKEIALAISAILLTFVGTTLVQAYAAFKAASADKKAEQGREEAIVGRVEAETGRQEVKEQLKSVEKALSSASASR